MIKKLIALVALFFGLCFSPAFADEVSTPPAPEFKQYQRDGVIDPSLAGLAKELSEQAKVIADLQENSRLDNELSKQSKFIDGLRDRIYALEVGFNGNTLNQYVDDIAERLKKLEARCKADCNYFSTSEVEINKRLARLEEKVSRLIKILKLQKEAVK
ncbi:MAG: hypothetical protein LCH63_10385 [Candidatus Melainabacteria bacterium]|nr:hypothetical protein [Candidatus Melainabacteria bacterium]